MTPPTPLTKAHLLDFFAQFTTKLQAPLNALQTPPELPLTTLRRLGLGRARKSTTSSEVDGT